MTTAYSPRSTRAVEVFAALRPGRAATMLANTNALTATTTIEVAGTVGSGTA
jgi:hypothetical protein